MVLLEVVSNFKRKLFILFIAENGCSFIGMGRLNSEARNLFFFCLKILGNIINSLSVILLNLLFFALGILYQEWSCMHLIKHIICTLQIIKVFTVLFVGCEDLCCKCKWFGGTYTRCKFQTM